MKNQQQRRERLRANDGRQANSTRAQLALAYASAAAANIDAVSIRWLCERAGIARSTFYTHFSSVEDLAAFVVTAGFERLARDDAHSRAGGTAGTVAARAGLSQVVHELTAQRHLLEYTFAVVSRPAVVHRMIEHFAAYTTLAVAAEFSDMGADRSRFVVDFVSAGVVHTVLGWLDAPEGVGEDDLVHLLVELLPARLRLAPDGRAGAASAPHDAAE